MKILFRTILLFISFLIFSCSDGGKTGKEETGNMADSDMLEKLEEDIGSHESEEEKKEKDDSTADDERDESSDLPNDENSDKNSEKDDSICNDDESEESDLFTDEETDVDSIISDNEEVDSNTDGDEDFVCNNSCDIEDKTECSEGKIRSCVKDADGCLSWSEFSNCTEGFCADEKTCGECQNSCPVAGETSCSEGKIRTCLADPNGCLSWGEESDCDDGFCVDEKICGKCNNECSENQSSCFEGKIKTCGKDINGCFRWGAETSCLSGFCKDTHSCDLCGNGIEDDSEICEKGAQTSCSNLGEAYLYGVATCLPDCSGWDKSACKSGGSLEITQIGSTKADSFTDIAVSQSGAIFLSGETSGKIGEQGVDGKQHYIVASLKPDLSPNFINISENNSEDRFNSISIYSDSKIIAAGALKNSQYYYDVYLASFNSDGSKEWEKSWGTKYSDEAHSLISCDGNIYIAGEEYGWYDEVNQDRIQNANVVLYGRDSEGNHLWKDKWGDYFNDKNLDIVSDAECNLYSGGFIFSHDSSPGDFWYSSYMIQSLNSSGEERWRDAWIHHNFQEALSAVVLDGSGNIFGAGYQEAKFTSNNDILLVKYSTEGSLIWRKIINNEKDTKIKDIAISESGKIFITGYTTDNFGGILNYGGKDIFLAEVDSSTGEVGNEKLFGTSQDDVPNAMAIDKDGVLYLAGFTAGDLDGDGENQSSGDKDAFVMKVFPEIFPEHCSNNVLDGNETDIDCGGPCKRCEALKNCTDERDCLSRLCENGECVPVRCEDRTCPDHSSCQLQENRAVCICEEGYTGSDCTECDEGYEKDESGNCNEICECTTGPCCDGCHFKPETTVCDKQVSCGTERCYKSDYYAGNYCNGYIGANCRKRYCSGASATCDGATSESELTRIKSCGIFYRCNTGSIKCEYDSRCGY